MTPLHLTARSAAMEYTRKENSAITETNSDVGIVTWEWGGTVLDLGGKSPNA